MQVLTRWHGAKALVVPNNLSLVPLPPRAPELNGQENIWQFMRQNWLSNRRALVTQFEDVHIRAVDDKFELPPTLDVLPQLGLGVALGSQLVLLVQQATNQQ